MCKPPLLLTSRIYRKTGRRKKKPLGRGEETACGYFVCMSWLNMPEGDDEDLLNVHHRPVRATGMAARGGEGGGGDIWKSAERWLRRWRRQLCAR